MSALLVFYGLVALAGHVAEPPAVSPTHDAAEHTHLEVPTSGQVVAADTVPAPWGRLVDCESGEWDADGNPIPGTRDWTYDDGLFRGGPNFLHSTYAAYRGPDMPEYADDASRWQQVEVAERVLADQGWRAWPTCSRMLGLR